MARISRSLDGLCSMASSRCALYIAGMLMIAGCSKGDDPQTVALIEEHLSPRAIHYENEKARTGRIVGLSLPNQREALEILPHLAKLERLETLTIGTEPLNDDDLDDDAAASEPKVFWSEFKLTIGSSVEPFSLR